MKPPKTKRIRLLSPSPESDSDDSQSTQLYLAPSIRNIISDFDKVSDEDLLSSHFCQKIKKKDIPLWSHKQVYTNTIRSCSKSLKERCIICERLCFSMELRGHSFVDKEWYFDKDRDYADPINKKQYISVHNDMEKYLRNDEIELRNISRKMVYNALILRFRRGYTKSEKDIIHLIEQHHNFYDYRSWILWKIKWDNTFVSMKHSFDGNNLYCCVCGNKCKIINEGSTKIQVCNKKGCNFMFNMKSDKTYVGPKTISF